ncbi:hypothetical protein [Actinomadura nitritigenes]|uniref:hypothetical protein n=1 Tax=Actinomadura nitritigenes TaxID=134602 RepID=UPI003D8AB5B0
MIVVVADDSQAGLRAVRPADVVRLSPAQWLFDPADVRLDEIDPYGLLGMIRPLEPHFGSGLPLPSEWA